MIPKVQLKKLKPLSGQVRRKLEAKKKLKASPKRKTLGKIQRSHTIFSKKSRWKGKHVKA